MRRRDDYLSYHPGWLPHAHPHRQGVAALPGTLCVQAVSVSINIVVGGGDSAACLVRRWPAI